MAAVRRSFAAVPFSERHSIIVAYRLGVLAVLLLGTCAWSPSRTDAAECTGRGGPPEDPGPPLEKSVKLTPVQPAEIVNFGPGDIANIAEDGTDFSFDDDYASKEIDIVIAASRRLPKGLEPSHIELNAPRRLTRADTGLETVVLEESTFSTPQFIENRHRITFTLCLNPADIEAGSYTGEVSVGGPTRLGGATVAITANAKDGKLFHFGLLVALAAVTALVIYRAHEAKADKNLREVTIKSFSWWATLVVALVAAYIAAISIYTQDPAWGDDQAPSIIALAGAALAGAGVHSVIATLRPASGDSDGAK
jgi:hypothetical protein